MRPQGDDANLMAGTDGDLVGISRYAGSSEAVLALTTGRSGDSLRVPHHHSMPTLIETTMRTSSRQFAAIASLARIVRHGYVRLDGSETLSVADSFDAGILPGSSKHEGGGAGRIAPR